MRETEGCTVKKTVGKSSTRPGERVRKPRSEKRMRLDRTAIIRYIKKCKNVIECNCVTGDYSMLLEVLFENTMELDRFIGELQYFGRTKTLIVFSTSVEHRGVEL